MSTAMFGGDDTPFDPAALNAQIDEILGGHRERMGADAVPGDPIPPTGEEGQPTGAEAIPPAPAPVGVQPAPEFVAPPAPALDDEDVIILRALRDPDRADAVRQAALGVTAPPPVAEAPAPPPPPAATLPEEVTPDSFEATLWRQQQEMLAELRATRERADAVGQQTAMDRARQAASAATASLVRKYGHALSTGEIEAVCKAAASRGWVDAMIRARGGEEAPGAIEAGMTDALEAVVRSDDGLLAKVLGGPTVAVPPAQEPVVPQAIPQPQHTPEAAERQRLLTALSPGASPTGTPAPRAPLEVDRGNGGMMTEVAKRALAQEIVGSGLRDQIEGG